MQINLFEILAQIINFFILLFVLQKFFYKPISDVMEKRQKQIDETIDESVRKMSEADELAKEYESKITELEKNKREILEGARKEANDIKSNLLEGYQLQAEEKREAFLKEIEDERDNFLVELQKKLGKSAVKISERILRDINDIELEEKMFDLLVKKIKNLEDEDFQDLSLSDQEHFILICDKPLKHEHKKIVENIIATTFVNYKDIVYKVDKKLILGYELKLETFTLHASIKKYIEEFEKIFERTVSRQSIFKEEGIRRAEKPT